MLESEKIGNVLKRRGIDDRHFDAMVYLVQGRKGKILEAWIRTKCTDEYESFDYILTSFTRQELYALARTARLLAQTRR
jgi:hypothetical protein